MNRMLTMVPLAALLLTAAACGPKTDHADENAAATAASAEHEADTPAADARAADSHAAAEGEGQALLPIMQRLGAEMMTLTHALMTEDRPTITRSAAAIAEHAPISAAELERIHTTLEEEMATFEALDERVHSASVRLNEAAQTGDFAAVAERLGEVQRGCVACHTQFRSRLLTTDAGR